MTPQRIKHYRLSDKLGEGGMGVVYRAQDEQLNRSVAIKLLSGKCAEDPKAVERFHREARITASLDHPHICTVYEFGDFADAPYMVMELLNGQTLNEPGLVPAGKFKAAQIQYASADSIRVVDLRRWLLSKPR